MMSVLPVAATCVPAASHSTGFPHRMPVLCPGALRHRTPCVLWFTSPPHHSLLQVTCLAQGGRPKPTFSWMLRTEGKGEEKEIEEAYNGAVEEVEGGQVITYTTQPEDHGKFLVCVVNHEGFGEEAIGQGLNKAEVKLDIRFKPVATSKSHKVWSMKLGESFDILLGFKANPEPTEIYWKMHDGTEVAQGSSNKRYTSDILKAGPHDGHFTAKLTIDKVLKTDGETTSKLIVKNQLGETTYEFVMGIGERPPPGELDMFVPKNTPTEFTLVHF